MLKSLRLLFLASTVLIPVAAHADTITVFDVSGVLNDGAGMSPSTVVTGTVSIDVTTGASASADLFFTTSGGTVYNLVDPSKPTLFVPGISYFIFDNGTGLKSFIEIPLNSLVGYTGGPQCTIDAICPPGTNASNFFEPGDSAIPNFQSGSLTAEVAATPEPSSLVLLGTGVLGFAGAVRRKLRA